MHRQDRSLQLNRSSGIFWEYNGPGRDRANLQTLAESTQRLSNKAKARKPEVDWRAIAGFRNVVVHDYLGVDLERIWHIVEFDLPGLRTHVNSLLVESGELC